MRAYLQHFGCRRRKSGSSRFEEESSPRTERTTHASGVGPGGAILHNFMNTAPLMLYGFSIIGAGKSFLLPRAGTPLSDVDLADATHISLLTSFEIFLLYLLSDSFTL